MDNIGETLGALEWAHIIGGTLLIFVFGGIWYKVFRVRYHKLLGPQGDMKGPEKYGACFVCAVAWILLVWRFF